MYGGCNPAELMKVVRENGIKPPKRNNVLELAKAAKSKKDNELLLQRAASLWAQSQPAEGTWVQNSLEHEDISIELPDSIRFLPECPYEGVLTFPAMICAMTDWKGNFKGVHRTLLGPDGIGLADVPDPKKALGPIKTASVHLGKADEVMMVSESVVTGLRSMIITPDIPA